MNTREDVHRELFGMLAAADRNDSPAPKVDRAAILALLAATNCCAAAWEASVFGRHGDLRDHAMAAAVAALRLVYSIDDALS